MVNLPPPRTSYPPLARETSTVADVPGSICNISSGRGFLFTSTPRYSTGEPSRSMWNRLSERLLDFGRSHSYIPSGASVGFATVTFTSISAGESPPSASRQYGEDPFVIAIRLVEIRWARTMYNVMSSRHSAAIHIPVNFLMMLGLPGQPHKIKGRPEPAFDSISTKTTSWARSRPSRLWRRGTSRRS